MPKGYIQSMLGEQEVMLYITRQHWFVFLSAILVEITVVIILAGIALVINILIPPTILYSVIVLIILLLVPLIGAIRDFLIWWNREYIVTNRRVIQISGVINKNVTDSSLEKVNDVKMEQSFLGRLFNYGDVEILTASELGVNLFRKIGDPVRFKTTMLNAKEALERGSVLESEETGDIPAMIERLAQLRDEGAITETEFQTKKAQLLARM
jgi:uncharacterized membrane protein YdbT with pleckstrin-like domain